MVYDKMPDYIESLYNVFQSVKSKTKSNDQRWQMISLIIFN